VNKELQTYTKWTSLSSLLTIQVQPSVQYLASGSSSVPNNTAVTSSSLQTLHSGGHVSPQKPMHGCLHGRSFVHGSLQGSLSHSSWHNFLQRWWMHDHSHGSCNNSTNMAGSCDHILSHNLMYCTTRYVTLKVTTKDLDKWINLQRLCDSRQIPTLMTSWIWICSKHYSTILNVFIMNHGVAKQLYSLRHHYSTQTNIYTLFTYNFWHTSVLWPSMGEIIIITQLKQNYWRFQYIIIKIIINIKYFIYYINKISVKFNNYLSKSVEINKGVRQGCPLSPTLFNIYLDKIITKWQKQDITGIKLSKNQQLSTLLFADDQFIIADREDNLQRAAHKLNQIITEYGLTISVQKTKSMSFRGRDPVRTKIVIDNKIIEQVNSFNYLVNMISYEK